MPTDRISGPGATAVPTAPPEPPQDKVLEEATEAILHRSPLLEPWQGEGLLEVPGFATGLRAPAPEGPERSEADLIVERRAGAGSDPLVLTTPTRCSRRIRVGRRTETDTQPIG